uniref:DDB1 and CUL4 associated factor 17 n=1 Tax=Salarias fasciatus TaxID=181472 RepID=A0A672JFH8_SALFA
MALYRGKRRRNAAELLVRRSMDSREAGTLLRHNMNILRGILLQDNRKFVKVWTKTSKSPIMYENGNIYFENYLNCYSCLHTEPRNLYKLPKRSKQEKIEDVLLCQSPLEKTLSSPSDHKPSILALTASNWLYRLSADTGEELQKVYLSPKCKFKYLFWNDSQETFFIKSIQTKETPLERQAGISHNFMMHLAIFHVSPLQPVGILEISKKVGTSPFLHVFAPLHTVCHSNFNLSLSGIWKWQKLSLGKPSALLGNHTVGDMPFGIPVNIQITGSLPVLFEVSCFDSGVHVGGHPWHYIYTPPQKTHRGTHHIRSLRDGTMAINGIQNMDCCSLESDSILFHPDDSGRIIHFGPTTINVLRIRGELDSSSPSEVVEDFSMQIKRKSVNVTVTSSGRTVKKRFNQLDDDPCQETFRMVVYENEIDLLAVVITNGVDGEGRAQVQLRDNHSGQIWRAVDLEELWDETFQHELFFDRDTIVHVEQKNANFCYHQNCQTCKESLESW